MASPFGHGNLPTLSDLKERLTDSGCQIKQLSGPIIGPSGPFDVFYAVNPANGQYAVLPQLADDERVTSANVKAVERQLGIKTGLFDS